MSPRKIKRSQRMLGHIKVDNTLRYFGVELEDPLSFAKRIDIKRRRRMELAVRRVNRFCKTRRFCNRSGSTGLNDWFGETCCNGSKRCGACEQFLRQQ